MLHVTYPEARRMLGMICFLEHVRKTFKARKPSCWRTRQNTGSMVTKAQIQAGQSAKGESHSSQELRRGGSERWKACFLATRKAGCNFWVRTAESKG